MSFQPAPTEKVCHFGDCEQTIYNRFVRWSRMGVFNRILAGLAGRKGQPAQKGAVPHRIGRTKEGFLPLRRTASTGYYQAVWETAQEK
jgi:hypothetical protein